MTTKLPIKDPAESVVIEFDFSEESASVANPQVSVVVKYDAPELLDPNPEAILSGLPRIDGASVFQRVAGGFARTDYGLRCLVTTPEGNQLVASGVLPVREKP